VDVGEDLSGVRAPVAKQPGLEVLGPEGFLEQRVVAKVRVGPAELIGGEGLALDGCPGCAKGGEGAVDGGRHGE
jgi:hypothetical protein